MSWVSGKGGSAEQIDDGAWGDGSRRDGFGEMGSWRWGLGRCVLARWVSTVSELAGKLRDEEDEGAG